MGIYYDAAVGYGYKSPAPDDEHEEERVVELIENGDGLSYTTVGDGWDTLVGLEGFVFSAEIPGAKAIDILPIPADYKEQLDSALRRAGIEPPRDEPQWWLGGTVG